MDLKGLSSPIVGLCACGTAFPGAAAVGRGLLGGTGAFVLAGTGFLLC